MNLEEKVIISLLLDYYGGLLTEPQRNMLSYRYNDDLSLAEIAEQEGITRQGVRDAILRGVKTLYEYEDKLRLRSRIDSLRNQLNDLYNLKAVANDEEIKSRLDHIIRGLEEN